jgi:cobalamin-dependent methionine synthase I
MIRRTSPSSSTRSSADHAIRSSRLPNLDGEIKLFALFDPDETIGVHLTAGFLLEPEQSTSAIVVHHPAAKYFVA